MAKNARTSPSKVAGALSRRTFVWGGAALAAGAGMTLAGCSSSTKEGRASTTASTASSGKSATAVPSARPQPGGTLTVGTTSPFNGVDPHSSVSGGSGVVPEVYSYLIRDFIAVYPKQGILQDLAEGQTLQSDSVTWVFKIRPNVMVAANSQGVPVRALDSSDVLASWQRIASKASGANGYGFANQWIDHMDAPDNSTFRMIMKGPYAWTLANVGSNLNGAIVPKEWLESANLKKQAVGTGPFTLSELVEGSHATMLKNPTYYRSGRPYLGKQVINLYADVGTQRTAFVAGQLDAYSPVDQAEAKQLKDSDPSLLYSHYPTVGYKSFWMRVDAAPWKDARVRNAVNMAIDRDQFISIIGKGAGDPIGPVTTAFGDYAISKGDLAKAQAFDVAEAKKLFTAAGITEFSFAFPTNSNTTDYVNVFVANMKLAGVDAKAQPLNAAAWLSGYFQNQLTASLSNNQTYQTPDAALQWYMPGGVTGNGHYDTNWTDADVTAAIRKAAAELDEDPREQAYKDAQKLILSKAPPFINFFALYGDTLVQDYMHDYPASLSSLAFAYFQDVWTSKQQ